jgi:hypothetical protein
MADETEAAGNFLTHKVGPLPVGIWMVAAGGIYLYVKRKNTAAGPGGPTALTPAGTVATTGGIGSSDMSHGGGSGGDTGSGGNTVAGQYSTNDAWGRAAVNFLVARGVDPTVANSAITQFLASQNLTADQQAQVNLAIQSLGAPPNLPQPGTAPPPITTPPGTIYAANPPTGLNATNIGMNSVDLTWNKATNATSYTVKYAAPGISAQTMSVNGTDTHATVAGLSPGTRYEFQVQAVPAKPSDSYASTSATTSNAPANQPPASQPPPAPAPAPAPAPGPSIPPGYHMQPAQYANLPGSMSLRQYWKLHYGEGNPQALNNLIYYNPNIPPDWTAHMALSIKTSDAHLVPDR